MATVGPHVRPLGATDIIDEAIRLYRRRFRLFLTIGAIALIPLAIVQLLMAIATTASNDVPIVLLAGLLNLLITVLAWMTLTSAMIHAASETWMGREITVQESFDYGLERVWSLLGLVFLFGLAVGLMFITLIGIPFAIYFAVAWSLAFQAVVIERMSVVRSLGRSRGLVKGHWWRVFGIALLIAIIQGVISAAFSLPGAMLGAGTMFADPTSEAPLLAQMASTIGSAAGQIVAGPIAICSVVLLYYDQRVRKEGLDLELAARQLDQFGESPRATSAF